MTPYMLTDATLENDVSRHQWRFRPNMLHPTKIWGMGSWEFFVCPVMIAVSTQFCVEGFLYFRIPKPLHFICSITWLFAVI